MKRNQNLALEVDAATPRVEALKEQVAKLSDKPETTDEQSEQIEKLETNLEEKWTSLKVNSWEHLRVVTSHFIFETNVGKRRIRHKTTLNLNDINFNGL